jgi:hypothetical protein
MSRTEVQDPTELAEVITHSTKENTPLCQNTKETTIHVNPTTAGKEIIPAAMVEESEFLAKSLNDVLPNYHNNIMGTAPSKKR